MLSPFSFYFYDDKFTKGFFSLFVVAREVGVESNPLGEIWCNESYSFVINIELWQELEALLGRKRCVDEIAKNGVELLCYSAAFDAGFKGFSSIALSFNLVETLAILSVGPGAKFETVEFAIVVVVVKAKIGSVEIECRVVKASGVVDFEDSIPLS